MMISFKVNDIDCYIGSNVIENDELFNKADANDTWFHVYTFPSAHMWIKQTNVDKNTLYKIALELKKRSKYKKISGLPIIYTTKSHLTKGYHAGTVLITGKSKVISV